ARNAPCPRGSQRCARFALRTLRLPRPEIRGDRQHVADVELFHHLLHQRRRVADPLAVLHAPQLAHDVVRMQAGYARHVAETLIALSVADPAGQRLAAALGDQGLALGDAALRHVGDKARAGIAVEHDVLVLGDLDDAVADRLAAAVGMGEPLVALADECLRDSVGLHHADPLAWLERREVLGRRLDLLVADRLGHGDHRAGALAVAALVVGHLADEVVDRQAGDVGGLVVPGAGRQVARRAGAYLLVLVAVRYHLRHRRLPGRGPVRPGGPRLRPPPGRA